MSLLDNIYIERLPLHVTQCALPFQGKDSGLSPFEKTSRHYATLRSGCCWPTASRLLEKAFQAEIMMSAHRNNFLIASFFAILRPQIVILYAIANVTAIVIARTIVSMIESVKNVTLCG